MATTSPATLVWQPDKPSLGKIPGGTGVQGSTLLGDMLENVLEHNPVTAQPHGNLIGQAEAQVLTFAAGADFVHFDTILADIGRLNAILSTGYTFGPEPPPTYGIAKATVLTVSSPALADGGGDVPQVVTGPGHGGVTLGSAGNAFLAPGSFTYTPDAAFTGDDGFTVRHADGSLEAVRVAVTAPVHNAPVANDDLFQKTFDPASRSLQVDAAHGVLANDTDPFGKPLAAHLVDKPAHGTLSLAADGSFLYTAAAAGPLVDHFTYDDDNGSARSPLQTAWIIVAAPSGSPQVHAAGDAYTVLAGQPTSIRAGEGLLANDGGGSGHLAAFLRGLPQHGTVGVGADGSLEYIPTSGFVGQDHFSYLAADGHGLPVVADVSVTVTHDTLF